MNRIRGLLIICKQYILLKILGKNDFEGNNFIRFASLLINSQ